MLARVVRCLDANAGLPPLREIVAGLPVVAESFYNPSSSHELGRQARALLRDATDAVSLSLSEHLSGLKNDQWIFTSGASEAIQGVIRACGLVPRLRVWFRTAVEHQASLASHVPPGVTVVELPVDSSGRLSREAFEQGHAEAQSRGLLREGDSFLLTLIWVNNETGVIQDGLQDILNAARARGGLTLVDGAQACGKLHTAGDTLAQDAADWVAFSGHKLGAFSGIGVLAFSPTGRRILTASPLVAGSQQLGLRAGTENVVGAWSLGRAASLKPWANSLELQKCRDELQFEICARIGGVRVQGISARRVANTLSVSFEGISSRGIPLVDQLDLEGFSVSAGSACSSGVRKPSHVLGALGHDEALALASLRISLTPGSSSGDLIELFVPALVRVIERSRKAG